MSLLTLYQSVCLALPFRYIHVLSPLQLIVNMLIKWKGTQTKLMVQIKIYKSNYIFQKLYLLSHWLMGCIILDLIQLHESPRITVWISVCRLDVSKTYGGIHLIMFYDYIMTYAYICIYIYIHVYVYICEFFSIQTYAFTFVLHSNTNVLES